MKKYLITFIIVIVIFSIGFMARKNKKVKIKEEFIRKVGIEEVVKGNVFLKKEFYGQIQGQEQTEIYPDVPGKFIKYKVKEGDFVKKGTIIAEIDRSVPGVQFESAKVKAPINGIVYDLTFTKGSPVIPQRPIAMISDNKKIIARIFVSSDILKNTNPNSKTEVYIGDNKFNGKIIRISKYVNNLTNTGSIDIQLETSERNIINNECRVFIYTYNKNNVIRIPVEAYHNINGEEYVYTFENGRAIKKIIESKIIGNEYVEIKDGLSEGDTVITTGSSILKENQKVRIK